MRKDKLIVGNIIAGTFFLLCIVIVLPYFLNLHDSNTYTKEEVLIRQEYAYGTRYLTPSNVDEVSVKKGTYYVYVGRISCPDCQKFFPNFVKALQQTNTEVLWIDTDNKDSNGTTKDPNIVSWREEYDIAGVPSLLKMKDGKIIERVQEEVLTEDELIKFLTNKKE